MKPTLPYETATEIAIADTRSGLLRLNLQGPGRGKGNIDLHVDPASPSIAFANLTCCISVVDPCVLALKLGCAEHADERQRVGYHNPKKHTQAIWGHLY